MAFVIGQKVGVIHHGMPDRAEVSVVTNMGVVHGKTVIRIEGSDVLFKDTGHGIKPKDAGRWSFPPTIFPLDSPEWIERGAPRLILHRRRELCSRLRDVKAETMTDAQEAAFRAALKLSTEDPHGA